MADRMAIAASCLPWLQTLLLLALTTPTAKNVRQDGEPLPHRVIPRHNSSSIPESPGRLAERQAGGQIRISWDHPLPPLSDHLDFHTRTPLLRRVDLVVFEAMFKRRNSEERETSVDGTRR